MSSNTLFVKHALIGEELELKQNVELKYSEGYIDRISIDVKASTEPKITDCLLIPGLINGHTHIGDSFAKEMGYGKTLSEVVEPPNGIKHRLLSTVSQEELISGMRLAIREMLSSGTTLFADYREGGIDGIYALKQLLKESMIKSIILGRPHPTVDMEKLQNVLKMSDGLGINSINLLSDSELELAKLFCVEGQKIISTHASETSQERDISFQKHGKSDIERAINTFNAEYLIHCIYSNDNDLDLIAKKNVAVGICPRANHYFGLDVPPIQKMIERDITLCLGTDNVMANSPDLFREMEFLAKYACHLKNPIPAREILKMVTINPARVFRLDHILGCLKEMNRADFFLLDLTAPNLRPINQSHIYETIVLRAKASNVVSTHVNGMKTHDRRELLS
ncbi:MAG: amidohydrolase family protein [Candidatus Helarchaeota archaeon]